MLSSSFTPVSAEQNLYPRRFVFRLILCGLLGIFIAPDCSQAAHASSLEDAARALARRVAAALRGGQVTYDAQNRSSLDAAEFASVSAAFADELQRQGIKIASADSGTSVAMTVTQSPTEYLAVAQVQRKDNPETLLEILGPVTGLTEAATPFSLELHRERLFSQDTPILDVFFASDWTTAFVLGPAEIGSYTRQSDHWALTSAERLPRYRAPARSERGFFGFGTDMASAEFPNELCQMYLLPDAKPRGWHCEKVATALGVRGVSADAEKLGPWYSAAQFEADGMIRRVITGQDGLARLFEDGSEPVATFSGWGSEIAALHSGCGSGWQLLVTSTTDWTKPDAIQAVEVRDRRAVPASAPMGFSGPIVALHTPGTSAVDPAKATSEAIAVDHNLQTGRYDAYLLSISCVH